MLGQGTCLDFAFLNSAFLLLQWPRPWSWAPLCNSVIPSQPTWCQPQTSAWSPFALPHRSISQPPGQCFLCSLQGGLAGQVASRVSFTVWIFAGKGEAWSIGLAHALEGRI